MRENFYVTNEFYNHSQLQFTRKAEDQNTSFSGHKLLPDISMKYNNINIYNYFNNNNSE